MKRMWHAANQEFRMTAADKAFVIITIIGPFLILGLTVPPGLLSMDTKISAGILMTGRRAGTGELLRWVRC